MWANSLKAKLVKKTDNGIASLDLKHVLSELTSLTKEHQGGGDASGAELMKLFQESSRPLEAGKTDEARREVEEIMRKGTSP